MLELYGFLVWHNCWICYCTAVPSWSCSQTVSKPVWRIPLLYVQRKTPDDAQRNCTKHVEFYSKNKSEKLVHLVGFVIWLILCIFLLPLCLSIIDTIAAISSHFTLVNLFYFGKISPRFLTTFFLVVVLNGVESKETCDIWLAGLIICAAGWFTV
jgi:hypothetical protein